MKHEFTNNDLGRALDQVTYDAGKIQGVPYFTLRQFLDALPEPQDDFQRGGVILDTDDVRKGDRVLIRNLANNLYEVTVTHVDKRAIIWKGSSINKSQIDRIHLLDRPNQHPDPDKHRYIVDHDDHDMLYQAYVSVQSNKADYLYYSPENYLGVAPEQFTNWSEAVVNVVADDE